MRLDSVRNGVSDARSNVCRRPRGHCRSNFCTRSQRSIWSIWRLRWESIFDRSGFPVASRTATIRVPVPRLESIFVFAQTPIRLWRSADGPVWPLLRFRGLWGSILPIFVFLSRRADWSDPGRFHSTRCSPPGLRVGICDRARGARQKAIRRRKYSAMLLGIHGRKEQGRVSLRRAAVGDSKALRSGHDTL